MISHWLPNSSWSPARAMSRPHDDARVLDAEPEEAERRLGQDDAGELEHGQRARAGVNRLGRMCVNTTRRRSAADHLGRLDERSLADREHDAAGHAGVDHPPVDGEDDADRPRRVPPTSAISSIASSSPGNDTCTSTQPMSHRSARPPLYPAIRPMSTPNVPASDHDEHADEQRRPGTVDEARRARRSPASRCPCGFDHVPPCHTGDAIALLRLPWFGSSGAISGARIATAEHQHEEDRREEPELVAHEFAEQPALR